MTSFDATLARSAGSPSSPGVGLEDQPLHLSRRYVGAAGRQTHLLEAGEPGDKPSLWCLHATAYSGRSFTPFLEVMAQHRRVVAADTMGYGGSDKPSSKLQITDYALLLDEALDAAAEGWVDLLGYHTGAIVAAELARLRPQRVRRLVLIGVPFATGEDQRAWRERLATPTTLGEDFQQFQDRWEYLVARRDPSVSLERAFGNFVDELRAYPDAWWAHEAAFTFDVESCFSGVSQPTLILNPDNQLSELSRRAASRLSRSQIIELKHLSHGIFDKAPEEIAALTEAFLADATI